MAELIVSNKKDIENRERHHKQCLNKLHEIDQIYKILSNKTDKKPIQFTQYNNLNVMALIENSGQSGKLAHLHYNK